jgi:beta-lactamase superfamily II metal-dependent hydrolase
MEAVRGLIPDNGSCGVGGLPAAEGSTGWAAPHCRQKACVGPTWFPHWLQKGIYLSLRYASRICSGKLPCRGHATILAMWKLRPAILLLALAAILPAAGKLEIYCIDVEGGKATLWVSPSGDSMLVDAGWPGFNHRDADRIAAAAKAAGVRKIDYLVVTHFHADHAGGVPQLAEKMTIRNFVDYGVDTETGQAAEVLYGEYSRVRDKGTHIVVKPGDKLPVKGLDVEIVSSDGALIVSPLAGAGQPNPACAGLKPPPPDQTENAHSIGMVVTYGDFRAVDLGDLSGDKEYGLVCPDNKLGTVRLFMVSHHGTDANSPALGDALHPQVAIMNNGARKGGSAEVWQTVHDSPGLEDFWQLHYAIAAGKDHNSPDPFIANIDEDCAGDWLKVTVEKDGTFTVYNQRNKFEKTYKRQ